jgi:hypothetical protein
MKKMHFLLFTAGLIGTGFIAPAQDLKIPQPSTSQTIEQDFGIGKISVTYSRPNAKGRSIFGAMEPYGQVWRTGANYATRIRFSDSVHMAGHPLPAGEYSLFTIPGQKEWTIILNKTVQQWGAYSYESTKDLLRFTVPTARLEPKMETFTIEFGNQTVEHGELQLMWGNTLVSIPLEIDADAQVMANIDKAMQTDKKPYYFAAIYYYNHNKDMNKALAWMRERDKATPNAYNVKYWIARIQLKMGDKTAAIATANEGLKLATAENSTEYMRMNNEVLADARK